MRSFLKTDHFTFVCTDSDFAITHRSTSAAPDQSSDTETTKNTPHRLPLPRRRFETLSPVILTNGIRLYETEQQKTDGGKKGHLSFKPVEPLRKNYPPVMSSPWDMANDTVMKELAVDTKRNRRVPIGQLILVPNNVNNSESEDDAKSKNSKNYLLMKNVAIVSNHTHDHLVAFNFSTGRCYDDFAFAMQADQGTSRLFKDSNSSRKMVALPQIEYPSDDIFNFVSFPFAFMQFDNATALRENHIQKGIVSFKKYKDTVRFPNTVGTSSQLLSQKDFSSMVEAEFEHGNRKQVWIKDQILFDESGGSAKNYSNSAESYSRCSLTFGPIASENYAGFVFEAAAEAYLVTFVSRRKSAATSNNTSTVKNDEYYPAESIHRRAFSIREKATLIPFFNGRPPILLESNGDANNNDENQVVARMICFRPDQQARFLVLSLKRSGEIEDTFVTTATDDCDEKNVDGQENQEAAEHEEQLRHLREEADATAACSSKGALVDIQAVHPSWPENNNNKNSIGILPDLFILYENQLDMLCLNMKTNTASRTTVAYNKPKDDSGRRCFISLAFVPVSPSRPDFIVAVGDFSSGISLYQIIPNNNNSKSSFNCYFLNRCVIPWYPKPVEKELPEYLPRPLTCLKLFWYSADSSSYDNDDDEQQKCSSSLIRELAFVANGWGTVSCGLLVEGDIKLANVEKEIAILSDPSNYPQNDSKTFPGVATQEFGHRFRLRNSRMNDDRSKITLDVVDALQEKELVSENDMDDLFIHNLKKEGKRNPAAKSAIKIGMGKFISESFSNLK